MGMNMSYCMCENTLRALTEVMEDINFDYLKRSESEMQSALRLVVACLDFAQDFGEDIISAAEDLPQTPRLKRSIDQAKTGIEVLSP